MIKRQLIVKEMINCHYTSYIFVTPRAEAFQETVGLIREFTFIDYRIAIEREKSRSTEKMTVPRKKKIIFRFSIYFSRLENNSMILCTE